MKVAVIQDSASKPEYEKVLQSFAMGVNKFGDTAELVQSSEHKNYDCSIIFGSYKRERGRKAHKGKGIIFDSGQNYVQLETQLIGRPITTHIHNEFRVGVNGFLWDQARWGFEFIQGDRSKKVFERNGYTTNINWNNTGEYILICIQKVGDASLRGADIFDWTYRTVEEIRKYTKRKIIIRPHPLYRKNLKHEELKETVKQFVAVEWQDNDLTKNTWIPITEQIKNAWCVVTFSSGAGIDAVLNGIPTIACDPGSMVSELTSHSLNRIESPYCGDIKTWANKIAYCQWNIDEFESGECWQHVRKSI